MEKNDHRGENNGYGNNGYKNVHEPMHSEYSKKQIPISTNINGKNINNQTL